MDKPFAITPVQTSADQRGWVSNLLDFLPLPPDKLRNMHVVEMKPGAIRGNHRHRIQTEWIVICGGPCRVAIEADGERHDEIVVGDRPIMLSLKPGVAHAVRYEGDGQAYLVCLTDTPYNFDAPDLERVNLLK